MLTLFLIMLGTFIIIVIFLSLVGIMGGSIGALFKIVFDGIDKKSKKKVAKERAEELAMKRKQQVAEANARAQKARNEQKN